MASTSTRDGTSEIKPLMPYLNVISPLALGKCHLERMPSAMMSSP